MRDLARLGFVLLGLDWLLSGVWSFVNEFGSGADGIESVAAFVTALAAAVAFGVVPGAFLVWHNQRLATRLFPAPGPELGLPDIAAAVLCILGAYLTVNGAAGVLAAVVLAIFTGLGGPSDPSLIGFLLQTQAIAGAKSLAILAFGLFLFLRPSKVRSLVTSRAV